MAAAHRGQRCGEHIARETSEPCKSSNIQSAHFRWGPGESPAFAVSRGDFDGDVHVRIFCGQSYDDSVHCHLPVDISRRGMMGFTLGLIIGVCVAIALIALVTAGDKP